MDYINEMNNLVASIDVRGTQEFMGKEIPVIEGGFGEGKRCLTDKTIAEIHSQPVGEIRKSINRNIKRFKEHIDYLDLQRSDMVTTLLNLGYSKQSITQAEHIYLLSERGYAKLIKIMDTDLAWEIHDKLIDEYFTMRKIINSSEQLKSTLLLEIYNGGQAGVLASKQLVELEKKPLINTIEKQSDAINELKPHAEYAERVLEDKKTLLTPTQIAKDFGMAGKALNALLHDLGVQYKQNGQWLLYAKYQGKGYTGPYQPDIPNAKPQTRWTQAGKKFIHDILRKNGYKTVLESKQQQQRFDFN
ncbi:phage antirepressor KilAC domain-containing protein [Intestinibacter sp.]|uniref:phage antirepressor KilAC domain-containing protein n=1 Tax=Intestinibacter sp. TaxID=1965304 RepID=UPI00307D7ECF